ncbi:MAG: response regulator [Epsilonproteobacteria bacterium]|nr:response regulator [Campylobacterota bacterium]
MMGVSSVKRIDKSIKVINEKELEYINLKRRYEKATKDKLKLAHLLTQVNSELEDSLNNEKRFIASVSHELRTPLTAILGYGELLGDTALNNKQKRYLDSIVQSSNHLLALVSDLLDVAKIGDNRIDLVPKEVDLDDILNDCADLIRSRIKSGVNFIVDIPMPEYKVKIDDKRVKQIFINLLSNASKFTTKGSIRFYVEEMRAIGDGMLKFVAKVDDTGNGIPKEVADTLFEPFQSTDKTQGTGLGLYISQKLAEMMGGEIRVESKEGIGSSFTVTLLMEITRKREIGKSLNRSNILMFSPKSKFVENLHRELVNLGTNFQNHDIDSEDLLSSLVHMVASGKFFDVGIFDVDSFKKNTDYIAGTFRAVNPNIKLIAIIDEKEHDSISLKEFDTVVSKPISYQRFIHHIEEIYSSDLFGNKTNIDYSTLDILIVEDVDINREYEKEMLDNFFGISCDTAENGQVAVDKVRSHNYDAVLMDMRMPVMDGLEATRTIREFNKSVPIICMSANVYKEDKIAAENAGMNDFIEKPLDKKDIESKLLKLINNEFKYDDCSIEHIYEEEKEDSGEELDIKDMALKHLQNNFNEAISKKLFNKAQESINEYVNRIKSNFKKKDTKELVEDFHALKGVLSNLGLKELAELAGELQDISDKGDFLSIDGKKSTLLDKLTPILN